MMKFTQTATALSLAAIMTACAGNGLEQARQVNPQGGAFATELYNGYLELATMEFAEGDYLDSDVFAQRAVASGTGGGVTPELISARILPEDKSGELASARDKLISALAAGAADKKPAEAAKAQVMFDCWMQEQEENFQPEDIAACRAQYLSAVAKLEEKKVAAATETKAEPAPAAEPEPAALPGPYIVYFGLDRAKLTSDAKVVLSDVVKAAAAGGYSKIVAVGHTDLAGSSDYNQALSRQRAEMVAAYLRDGGVSKISTAAEGQSRPAVSTADGQPEEKNRRVEIRFVR